MGVCWSHCNRAEQSQASTKAETANEWVSVTAFPPLALKLRICLSGTQSFILIFNYRAYFIIFFPPKRWHYSPSEFQVDLLLWTIKSPRWDLRHLGRTNNANYQFVPSRFVRKKSRDNYQSRAWHWIITWDSLHQWHYSRHFRNFKKL